jgi:hypothetical protein
MPSRALLGRWRIRSEDEIEDSEYDQKADQENDSDHPANDFEHRHLWRVGTLNDVVAA